MSARLMASEYVQEIELPRLREQVRAGRTRILWVTIDGTRPPVPEERLQAVGDPERPLAQLHKAEADEVLAALGKAVEEAYQS